MANCCGLSQEQYDALLASGIQVSEPELCSDYERNNSCGLSAAELLQTYALYDPQIQTNPSYSTGARVLNIEKDGYELGLYEALENLGPVPLEFDSEKWEEVCRVRRSEPIDVGLITDFFNQYEEYELDPLDVGVGNFFYSAGDIFSVVGECGDTVCAYLCVTNFPATEQNFNSYKNFKPSPFFTKLYCVGTGANRCLEVPRRATIPEAYKVVRIGSRGHYVEVPIPHFYSPVVLLPSEVEEDP